MSRKKNGTTTEVVPEGEQQGIMEVKLRGPAEQVREQMGIAEQARPHEAEPVDDKFIEALNDPKYVAVVKRTRPREYNGMRVNLEVAKFDLPMPWQDIVDEVSTNYGGKKYRVAVIDPNSGEIIEARALDVDGDPIVKDDINPDARSEMFMNDVEKSAAEITEEALEQQTRMTAKQLEYERYQQQLEDLRKMKSGGPKNEVDSQIAAMERKLIESEYKSKLEAMQVRMEELAKRAETPKENGAMAQMMQMLMEQQRKSDERFERMMQQFQNNQMTQIQHQLEGLKGSKRDGNALLESIETLKSVTEILGIDLPGTRGHDDEPKEWWQILIEEHVPKLLDIFEDKKKEGKDITKEEMIQQLNLAADKATAEAVARLKAEKSREIQAKPASLPSAPPAPVAPTPPTREVPSLEEEVKVRIGSVLGILEREMVIRPRGYQWPLAAWETLPEPILEALVLSPTLAESLAIFDGKTNPNGLQMLRNQLADPKINAWATKGFEELRGWVKASQQDPSFDPMEEPEAVESGT